MCWRYAVTSWRWKFSLIVNFSRSLEQSAEIVLYNIPREIFNLNFSQGNSVDDVNIFSFLLKADTYN